MILLLRLLLSANMYEMALQSCGQDRAVLLVLLWLWLLISLLKRIDGLLLTFKEVVESVCCAGPLNCCDVSPKET